MGMGGQPSYRVTYRTSRYPGRPVNPFQITSIPRIFITYFGKLFIVPLPGFLTDAQFPYRVFNDSQRSHLNLVLDCSLIKSWFHRSISLISVSCAIFWCSIRKLSSVWANIQSVALGFPPLLSFITPSFLPFIFMTNRRANSFHHKLHTFTLKSSSFLAQFLNCYCRGYCSKFKPAKFPPNSLRRGPATAY